MRWILQTISSLRNYDWILTIVIFILVSLGLTTIYSVDLSRGENLIYFPTQSISFLIGIFVLFFIGSFHFTLYKASARLVYFTSFLLLVGVLIFGQTIRGTTGWFRIVGFSFQPSEFAKVALIIFLSWWISRFGRRFDKWQFVFTSAAITGLFILLILMQPDLGSAFVLGAIWFGLLFLTGTKKRYIVAVVGSIIMISIMSWFFVLQDYQKDRLLTFIDPNSKERALTTGYNINQSLIAVGSGGFFGRGLGFGSQSQLRFLPEAQTDFIFSVIAEELGFVGVFMVLSLYGLILWRLIVIALSSDEDFAVYTVLGTALLFLIQMLVNIGATINLLPVTGVTLPFLSYGGSSLIMNFVLIGIVQSIARASSIKRIGTIV